MPEPIAQWNSARDVWETPGTGNLFCEHSDVFSETFPTSGSMRSGVVYAQPTWKVATDDSGSSYSPPDETLLPTPLANEAEKAWLGPRVSKGQKYLSHVIGEHLLPTPTTSEATGAGNGPNKTGGDNLRTVVTLLPTPTVGMTQGGNKTRSGDRSGELLLNGVAEAATEGKLLPTPRAQNGEDRNQTIWARPADQPQNLENALAVTLPIGDHTPQLFVDGKPCEEPHLPLPN